MDEQEKIKTPIDPEDKVHPGDEMHPAEENGPEENVHTDGEGETMVALTLAEYDALQEELETAKAEAAGNLDSWQRAVADYNNLRRRTEMEREQMHSDLTGKILRPFLDMLDDLELAVQNRPQDGAHEAWSEGIELVYRKLLGKLESVMVVPMEVSGQIFDPHFHEAITHEENEAYKSGEIIAVVKPGYMIGNKVLRPAMVRVAA